MPVTVLREGMSLSSMHPLMQEEVGAAGVATPTLPTAEGLLPSMGTLVAEQGRAVSEAASALGALMRFLACVPPAMLHQAGQLGKVAPTLGASIGTLPTMCALVRSQC